MGALPPVLDPQMSTAADGMQWYSAAFDALTSMSNDGKVEPALATKWTSTSPTEWDFTLRTDVKFANGEPFTPQDAAFSINRVIDPKTASPVAARIPLVSTVTATADGIHIVTKAPDPILPQRLSVIFMLPQKYLEQVGADGFAAEPIGTGAFKLVSFAKGDRLVMDRATTSWHEPASVNTVTLIQIPDQSARIDALLSGSVDVAAGVPPDQAERIKSSGLNLTTGLAAQMCMLNLNNRYGAPLSDPKVRLALNYAIDKDALNKSILDGLGAVPQGQPVGKDAVGFNPKLQAFPYDPAKAKSMLAEAGYPNGFSDTVVSTNGVFTADSQAVQAVVGQLAEVGVKVTVQVQDAATYSANLRAGNMKQMLFHCLNYFPVLDADFLLQLYQCSAAYKWYCNHQFDAVYKESTTILDPAQRQATLQQAMQLLNQSPPGIFLYQSPVIAASAKNVHGVAARSDTVLVFNDITKG